MWITPHVDTFRSFGLQQRNFRHISENVLGFTVNTVFLSISSEFPCILVSHTVLFLHSCV